MIDPVVLQQCRIFFQCFFSAQTSDFHALFEQELEGRVETAALKFRGAISELPGTHNNLSFDWLMGLSDKGHLIRLNGCNTSSWGHTHSSDVWLQPDSLLNFLYSESPLLDLIIWGKFEGCPCQGFLRHVERRCGL